MLQLPVLLFLSWSLSWRTSHAFVPSLPSNHHASPTRLYYQQGSTPDFYAVLGVSKSANTAEIKSAYRSLAKQYHPDANLHQDTTELFQEINRAYEVLNTPDLKEQYDGANAQRAAARKTTTTVQPNGWPDMHSPARNTFFNDDTLGGNQNFDPFAGGFQRPNHWAESSTPVDDTTTKEKPYQRPFTTCDNFKDIYNFNDANNNDGSNGQRSGGTKVHDDFTHAYTHEKSSRKTTDVYDFHTHYKNAQSSPTDHFGSQVHDDIFSGSSAASSSDSFTVGPAVGGDLRLDVQISLKTAIYGGSQTVTVKFKDTCQSCQGHGGTLSNQPCRPCKGSGVMNQASSAASLGKFEAHPTCPSCRGTGKAIEKHCAACSGEGLAAAQEEITLEIPPGVHNGHRLLVREGGDAAPGPNALRGDLYIYLEIQEESSARREGYDIYSEQSISYIDAILGGHVTCAFDPDVTIEIPAGTQAGSVLRLEGCGAPRLDSDLRGDHYVAIHIDIPTEVTTQQVGLLEQLRSTISADAQQQQQAVPEQPPAQQAATTGFGSFFH